MWYGPKDKLRNLPIEIYLEKEWKVAIFNTISHIDAAEALSIQVTVREVTGP